MGNSNSRGAHAPQYPPKHTYYSEGRGYYKPRKGGGGKLQYREEPELHHEYHERYPSHSSSGYPHHYNTYQPAYAAPYHYEPIPPPTLPFPNVSTPSPYPVIPPVPPRHHHSSSAPAMMPSTSYLSQANVHMPEPAPAPAVYPSQPMPGGPVIPNMMYMPQASAYPGPSSSIPAMPHAATPFPEPHLNDVPDTDGSEDSIPPHDIPEAPRLAPGQYGHSRYRYERPKSMKFHHNPLPPPPKDIFERSPYIGLLKDLHRPVEETTLRRVATSPQYVNAYIVSPTGSQASREKKPRKGLFHSLSSRLGGKSKREFQPPTAQPVPIMLATTTAPPPLMFPPVIPGVGYPPVIPTPGTVFSSGSGQEPVIPGGVRSTTPQVPQAPPSPAPSHRSHRSRHSMRSRLSPQPMLKIDTHNEYASLTHLSPHRILHERKRWPTAFHLLEAFRFMDTRPDIAEQIRRCPSTDEVKAIVSQNSASSRPDWETVVIQFMEDVLYMKFTQYPDLRRLLLSTGAAKLLHVDPHDNFWGDGPLGRGANELGRALEHVRQRLISEGFTLDDS